MIRGVIHYTGSPDAKAKALRGAVKAAMEETGQFWWQQILPVHFTTEGEKRYGYQARTKAYTLRKTRKFGHRNPLVWSGALKRDVTQRARVVGSSKGVKVHMQGPRYLWAYRKDRKASDKAAEIVAIVQREVDSLAGVMGGRLERELTAVRTPETRS